MKRLSALSCVTSTATQNCPQCNSRACVSRKQSELFLSLSLLMPCIGLTRRHIIELGYKLRCFGSGQRGFCEERLPLPKKQYVWNYCHIATDLVDSLCFFPFLPTFPQLLSDCPCQASQLTGHTLEVNNIAGAHIQLLVKKRFFQSTQKQCCIQLGINI